MVKVFLCLFCGEWRNEIDIRLSTEFGIFEKIVLIVHPEFETRVILLFLISKHQGVISHFFCGRPLLYTFDFEFDFTPGLFQFNYHQLEILK